MWRRAKPATIITVLSHPRFGSVCDKWDSVKVSRKRQKNHFEMKMNWCFSFLHGSVRAGWIGSGLPDRFQPRTGTTDTSFSLLNPLWNLMYSSFCLSSLLSPIFTKHSPRMFTTQALRTKKKFSLFQIWTEAILPKRTRSRWVRGDLRETSFYLLIVLATFYSIALPGMPYVIATNVVNLPLSAVQWIDNLQSTTQVTGAINDTTTNESTLASLKRRYEDTQENDAALERKE